MRTEYACAVLGIWGGLFHLVRTQHGRNTNTVLSIIIVA